MVRDKRVSSIIWSVRGTFSVRDVVTDLVAGSVPFLGGHAHKGMVLSVQRLFRDVWPVVQQAMASNPGYGLVLVGHSLGGAVASMLAMMIRHHLPDGMAPSRARVVAHHAPQWKSLAGRLDAHRV